MARAVQAPAGTRNDRRVGFWRTDAQSAVRSEGSLPMPAHIMIVNDDTDLLGHDRGGPRRRGRSSPNLLLGNRGAGRIG